MSEADPIAPSLDDFARLARQAFDALPEPFKSAAGEVVIRVDDFPDEETLASFGMEDPFELDAVEQATTPEARALALSELSYLLNDNVEVITAPPQPEA